MKVGAWSLLSLRLAPSASPWLTPISFQHFHRFSLLHHHLLQALRSKPLALTTRESSLVSFPFHPDPSSFLKACLTNLHFLEQSRNLPDFPTAVGITRESRGIFSSSQCSLTLPPLSRIETVSNLLSHNGDVAFDRCIAMTYSLDLAVRAVYIKVVGEATRKLVVKEKRNRFEIDDRHPLLEVSFSHVELYM